MDRRVLVPALALAVLVLVVASALLVFRGGGLEGVLPGQDKVVRLRPGEKAVVGGAELMVDSGVARYFACRDPEIGWELILEARTGWVLAVLVVYHNPPPGHLERAAWVEQYTANLTTARGETIRHCDQNTCSDKIWLVDWPRGEAVECRYYKNPYQYLNVITFPIKPGDEPAVARLRLYTDHGRYMVEVRFKD